MRILTSWIVAFVLVLPRLAFGQALKPADLVGTWVIAHDGKEFVDSLKGKLMVDMLTLKADGSSTREMKIKKGDSMVVAWKGQTSLWKLTGDTLRFYDGAIDLSTHTEGSTYVVHRTDRRLALWDWGMWDAGRHEERCAESVFERYDPSKQPTVPPQPQIMINPADLVGTWAGRINTRDWGTVADTFVIGADYSLRSAHVGPADDAHEKGTWSLLPGDILAGPLGNMTRIKVMLENGELVRCGSARAVLKRIAP